VAAARRNGSAPGERTHGTPPAGSRARPPASRCSFFPLRLEKTPEPLTLAGSAGTPTPKQTGKPGPAAATPPAFPRYRETRGGFARISPASCAPSSRRRRCTARSAARPAAATAGPPPVAPTAPPDKPRRPPSRSTPCLNNNPSRTPTPSSGLPHCLSRLRAVTHIGILSGRRLGAKSRCFLRAIGHPRSPCAGRESASNRGHLPCLTGGIEYLGEKNESTTETLASTT